MLANTGDYPPKNVVFLDDLRQQGKSSRRIDNLSAANHWRGR